MTEWALHLSDEMRRHGLLPDVVTYWFLSAHAKVQFDREGLAALHQMQRHGLHPNVVTYTATFLEYSSLGITCIR